MESNITELRAENFDVFVKEDKVVVDFWAEWCGPCRVMASVFAEAAVELKDKAKFGKVNVDDNIGLAQRFGVMSIPTTIFFRDGELIDRAVGVMSKEDLVRRVKKIR